MKTPPARILVAALLAGAASGVVVARDADVRTGSAPIRDALAGVEEDVRIYDIHLTTLANPYMQGRVPGSEGMERAKDYVEYHFREYGLEPPFAAEGGASYRQPFDLGGTIKVQRAEMAALAGFKALQFEPGEDFNVLGLGGSGEASAQVTFAGYSIDNGPDGWSSYPEDFSFDGDIAMIFRFEPLDENGRSLWTGGDGWTPQASFSGKVRAAIDRGASAVIIVNPPDCADPRAAELMEPGSGGRGRGDVPVVMLSAEAAARFVEAADPEGRSLRELRDLADRGIEPVRMSAMVSVASEIGREMMVAENVGGLLPGRGALASELIVVGAHLDHLGMGYFGSRSGAGTLHPGADDNASGSAGIMLFAEKLAKTFAGMPEDQPRRSVLFVAFSGEESGLHGSRAYLDDPITGLDRHVLMINFDMIGRIENDRVSISGAYTAEGLQDWVQPYFDASPLVVVQPERMTGASDHTSFYRRDIPVLFGIIADFHDDYHTPADVAWKINRLGATRTIRLFHDIVRDYAMLDETFPFAGSSEGGGRQPDARPEPSGPRLSDIRVRFGIVPGSYDASQPGIPIAGVTEGAPAAAAGVRAGDTLVRWDGQKIESIEGWMALLARHNPGDKVNIGVEREGEEITLEVTLVGKDDG